MDIYHHESLSNIIEIYALPHKTGGVSVFSRYLSTLSCKNAALIRAKFLDYAVRLSEGERFSNKQKDNFLRTNGSVQLRELKHDKARLYYLRLNDLNEHKPGAFLIFLRGGDKGSQKSDIDWCVRFIEDNYADIVLKNFKTAAVP